MADMRRDDECWWEPRRPGERTFAYLARVLDELGADQLAANARAAHYDDFECPEEIDDGLNMHRLIRDLDSWARGTNRAARFRTRVMIAAVKAGEFDSTKEESDRYAASARGQRDMVGLLDSIRKEQG
jgi:hypothetical protein